jgi:hypothetical protein
MASATTLAQIAALVGSVREKYPAARVCGVSTPERCDGVDSVSVNGERLPLRQCDSALGVREALLEPDPAARPLVIVTPLSDDDLEADVRARLTPRRLLTLRVWDAVRSLLRVRALDPRLGDEAVAHAILSAPGVATRAVPSGFLDLDTAWDLAGESVGLRSGRPDVLELLRWSQDGGGEAWTGASPELRAALRRRVRESAGAAGEFVLDALGDPSGVDVVALGLCCAVVFHPAAPGEARGALERAAGRLERFCGQRALPAEAGRAWAQAAVTYVRDRRAEMGVADVRPSLLRADALLREVDAQEWAFLSALSPHGFEQRLARFASSAEAALDGRGASPEAARRVEQCAREVEAHALSGEPPERLERVRMALRLVRALRRPVSEPRSFDEHVLLYASDSAFIDWARTELGGGDGCEPLARLYTRLVAEAGRRREIENERFARSLADWLASGGRLRSAHAVESVLDAVLAPLAERAPVLLLVIDGLSVAVFREIVEDLVHEGWIESVPEDGPDVRAVVSALPCVTEVSRASLLCGRLTAGAAAAEQEGFQNHVALLAHCRRGKPPVLLHKADLVGGGEGGLAPAARAEIADPARRVVGVVINAVDDHLAKGEQIRPRWGIEAIRPLRPILHAALEAERVVIVTSDHGHVVEAGSVAGTPAEAERWRADDGRPGAGEIALRGPRVVLPRTQRLIAPWSEKLRYGGRKNGYHGGASPQEIVIPLGVFSGGLSLRGWREVPSFYPSWWSDEGAVAASVARPVPVMKRRPRTAPAQAALPFEPAVPAPAEVAAARVSPAGVPPAPGVAVGAEWIEALPRSAVWKTQLQAAGRVASDIARLRQALMAFEERGGTLTRQALAHKLSLPPVRLGGFVAALRRVLNVDGYEVLSVEDASDTLRLNRDLLSRQFGLEAE